MLKSLVFTSLVLGITTMANARPSPDAVGVCYEFKGDEIKSRDVCIITSGNAAGGMYTNLNLINGKLYQIASHGISGINDDLYDLNGEDAVHYLRDASFLQVSTYDELAEVNEDAIYCYKTKKLNLCHN